MSILRQGFLRLTHMLYRLLAQRVLFQLPADEAHQRLMDWLIVIDQHPRWNALAARIHRFSFAPRPVVVGGVNLPQPFIVAAGLVKGVGFADEAAALRAVEHGVNIIPGWQILPRLLGLIEFGSYTRYPRLGNPGVVMWRHTGMWYTQNRVGLKNPGVVAAAEFLRRHQADLPPLFGINIAVSPGVEDETQSIREVEESLTAFISRGVVPAWFTLNLSCPNTEDDPGSHQTASKTRALCRAALAQLQALGCSAPLWVKVSPLLAVEQYATLMQVFAEVGVRAVIATNTLAAPSPDDERVLAGIGGTLLHPHAMTAATHLTLSKVRGGHPVDVIGCGGLMDGASYRDFRTLGIEVVQYWSALVFRGPLVAPLIAIESELEDVPLGTASRAGAAGD